MNRKLLVVSVAAAVLAAGATSANTMHKKHSMSEAERYAEPVQPIPYAQLDAYLNGSRSGREQILAEASARGNQTAQNTMTSPTVRSDSGASSGDATAPNTGVSSTDAAPAAAANPADGAGSATTRPSGSDATTPSTGDTTSGAPMNGPAAPSASPNTPQQ
jgi:hypothetical protein